MPQLVPRSVTTTTGNSMQCAVRMPEEATDLHVGSQPATTNTVNFSKNVIGVTEEATDQPAVSELTTTIPENFLTEDLVPSKIFND